MNHNYNYNFNPTYELVYTTIESPIGYYPCGYKRIYTTNNYQTNNGVVVEPVYSVKIYYKPLG